MSIEWATLQTYPEADCTKIRVYLKNTSEKPLLVNGAYLDNQYLSLVAGELDRLTALTDYGDIDASRKGVAGIAVGSKTGSSQWYRALPNPVSPNGVSEVTISLWGIVGKALLRIPVRGQSELRCDLMARPVGMYLSRIAFDPRDPNNVYVYCRNEGNDEIRVDRLTVDAEEVPIVATIPSGQAIAPESKTCIIIRPAKPLKWGDYVSVGVMDAEGERTQALVRVCNVFPVTALQPDARGEMLFDASNGVVRDVSQGTRTLTSECPRERYSVVKEIEVRDETQWERSASQIMELLASARLGRPDIPGQITLPYMLDRRSAMFFGGLADLTQMEAFRIRLDGIHENARRFEDYRRAIDPKPAIGIQEAFQVDRFYAWRRKLTAPEIAYSAWSLIAEGSMGLCYFDRKLTGADSNGYDAMPGAVWGVARTNMSIQLLKPFLRVGDAYDGLARSDTAAVKCKTVLCADKGLVLVLLHEPEHNQDSLNAPFVWQPSGECNVTVSIPEGVSVESVQRVDAGLYETAYKTTEHGIVLQADSINEVAVYCLVFGADDGPREIRARMSRTAGQESASSDGDCWQSYLARITGLSEEVVGGPPLDTRRITEIGHVLGQAKDTCLQELRAKLDGILKSDLSQQNTDLADLLDTYLRLEHLRGGQKNALHAAVRASNSMNVAQSIADVYVRHGHFMDAIATLSQFVSHENSILRNSAALCITNLVSDTLADPEAAVPWVEIIAKDKALLQNPKVRMYVAGLWLDANRPAEAAELLREIPVEATDPSVQYYLGVACFRLNKNDEALRYLHECVQTDNAHTADAWYLIGRIHLSAQRYPDAGKAMAKVLDTARNDSLRDSAQRLLLQMREAQGHNTRKGS